jgi:myo-inositol-1(or 4)-monophosphatase
MQMTTAASVLSTTEEVPDLDAREALCRAIALSAGELARAAFADRGAGWVDMKGPQDFLTETDAAVEAHLKAEIARTFPEDGFLGEEGGGAVSGNVWVVDPIDGTANFARGIPHYCISIAFVAAGETRLGAICNPSTNELYCARQGRGATCNGQPIRVAPTRDFNAACVELGWSLRVPNETYMKVLDDILGQGANVRRAASGALGLAYVADGKSDAYAELHMHPWDCLAGLLLVHEAGGLVVPFLEQGGLAGGGAVLAATPGIAEGISRATGIKVA